MLLIVLSLAADAQTLTVDGACPGRVELSVSDVTPSGAFALVVGEPGEMAGPLGPCDDLELGIAPPGRSFIGRVDGAGERRLTPTLSDAACGQSAVVVDTTTCTTSAVASLAPVGRCEGAFATIEGPADVAAYSGCSELDALYLHITDGVGPVVLPELERVHQYVYFHQNTGVDLVSLPLLKSVGEYVYFHENSGLERVDLGELEEVGGYLYALGNPDLTRLRLTSLTGVADYVNITGNDALCVEDLDWAAISGDVSVDAPLCD